LPVVLTEALLSRIEALSDVAKQLLRVAAVARRQVSHGLLLGATGHPEPELELGLREAIDAQILVVDGSPGTYGFRHMLTQEALYGDLLPSERVRLHATFATLLTIASSQGRCEAEAAELAYHCLKSRDLPGALVASVRAAADAERVAAPAEALRHLTQAIQLWDQVPDAVVVTSSDWTALLLRAAAAASGSGDPERAAALTREAIAGLDEEQNPELAATAHERLAEYLLETDEVHPEALAACQRAAELMPRDPPTPLRARITAALARALMRAERDQEAQHWCEEAVAVARAIHSRGEEADVLVTQSVLKHFSGDLSAARRLCREARELAVAGNQLVVELRATYNLGILEFWAGNLAAARSLFAQGADCAGSAGLGWSQLGARFRAWQSYLPYVMGRWDDAERLTVAFDDLPAMPAFLQCSVVALRLEVGRGNARAVDRLASLKDMALDLVDRATVALCEAEWVLWQGNADQARAVVQGQFAVGLI
jgi:hypothetical protein